MANTRMFNRASNQLAATADCVANTICNSINEIAKVAGGCLIAAGEWLSNDTDTAPTVKRRKKKKSSKRKGTITP